MINHSVRAALLLAAAAALSACGGGSKTTSSAAAPAVVVAPALPENAIGASFGTAFRASETAAPVMPADGDILPLSLTTDPVKVG